MCCWLIFRILLFLSSRPTWHLESQKSIMSPSRMKGRKTGMWLSSRPGSPLTRRLTKGKGNHTAYLIHKKTLWNGLLGGIQSGTSRGIDGTAPGRRDTWPGQVACWACISGHRPILWELLSHAVWRTHGLGSTYGHASVFISVRRDVIAFSHRRSSISGADRDDTASQGKMKRPPLFPGVAN